MAVSEANMTASDGFLFIIIIAIQTGTCPVVTFYYRQQLLNRFKLFGPIMLRNKGTTLFPVIPFPSIKY